MRLAIVIAALFALSSAPAYAGSGLCLWNSLPVQQREFLLSAYASAGVGGVARAGNQVNASAYFGCMKQIPGVDDFRSARTTLESYVVELGVVEALRREGSLANQYALENAWLGLPAEKRNSIRLAASGVLKIDPTVAELFMEAATFAGWKDSGDGTDDPLFRRYLDFFLARADRDLSEPNF